MNDSTTLILTIYIFMNIWVAIFVVDTTKRITDMKVIKVYNILLMAFFLPAMIIGNILDFEIYNKKS